MKYKALFVAVCLWGAGPPKFMHFAERPMGTTYTISGQGYGIAWGSVRVEPWDRMDRTEWYSMKANRAVWWDIAGDIEYVLDEPVPKVIDGVTYHFMPAVSYQYLPLLGAVQVGAYCVEFYEWMLQNPGEPTNDWPTEMRYATLHIRITVPFPDFDENGMLESDDVTAMLTAWSAHGGVSDFNDDGVVNQADLRIVASLLQIDTLVCIDLNDDGKVDTRDFNLYLAEWAANRTTDEE